MSFGNNISGENIAMPAEDIFLSEQLIDFMQRLGFEDIDHRIDVGNCSYRTPISEAIERNLPEIVTELLQNGVEVDQNCDGTFSPLGLAARCCFKNICEIILAFNASVDFIPQHDTAHPQKFFAKNTPLMFACCAYRRFKFNIVDGHEAIELEDYNIVKKDAVTTAMFLIERGANVNALDEDNATILFGAIQNYELTRLLLSKGINIHMRDNQGSTALHSILENSTPGLFYRDPFESVPKNVDVVEEDKASIRYFAPDIDAVREVASALIQQNFRKYRLNKV